LRPAFSTPADQGNKEGRARRHPHRSRFCPQNVAVEQGARIGCPADGNLRVPL